MAKAFNKGSYTNYSNKIGLYSKLKGSFISNSRDVVLNFPYKDCVLVGGMTKEDAKRDEKFLNGDALLANNDIKDIDVLLDPKVFTNFKYVSGGGERSLSASDDLEFFDEDGELKQNLLIKGNNLIALYSLYPRLAGKIKLIYIDPPYNTGNDGFKYNDSFNHSAWLTFMKNRLEIARQLLREDGTIVIHCDDNEQAYLKVLCDEVLYAYRFVTTIPRITSFQRSGQEKHVNVSHDYMVVYTGTDDFGMVDRRHDSSVRILEDRNGHYIQGDTKAILAAQSQGYSKGGDYDYEYNGKTYRPVDKNGVRNRWLWTRERMDAAASLGILVETGNTLRMQVYLDKKFEQGTNKLVPKEQGLRFHTADFMTSKKFDNPTGVNELTSVMGHRIPTMTPKPEALIKTLVEMTTENDDIILDFCLGSGTTAAVAHKMGRRWIGIEQMDYIETIAKKRLEKVIAGEQGGISKSVGWQGGGDFVYMELKKYNQDYVDRIWAAQTYGELDAIKDEMLQNAFLKFWFTKADFDAKWRDGEINARKVELINLLDTNQLYLNYADMDDVRYKVSDDDKALTKRFYGPDEDGEEISADVDIDDIIDDGDGMETSGE